MGSGRPFYFLQFIWFLWYWEHVIWENLKSQVCTWFTIFRIEIEEFQISKATSIFLVSILSSNRQFRKHLRKFLTVIPINFFNKWFIRKLWYSAFVTFGNFLILLLQLLGWKKCIFCISQGKSLKFNHTILIPKFLIKVTYLNSKNLQ